VLSEEQGTGSDIQACCPEQPETRSGLCTCTTQANVPCTCLQAHRAVLRSDPGSGSRRAIWKTPVRCNITGRFTCAVAIQQVAHIHLAHDKQLQWRQKCSRFRAVEQISRHVIRMTSMPPAVPAAAAAAAAAAVCVCCCAGAITLSALEGRSGRDSPQTLVTCIVRADWGGWLSSKSTMYGLGQVRRALNNCPWRPRRHPIGALQSTRIPYAYRVASRPPTTAVHNPLGPLQSFFKKTMHCPLKRSAGILMCHLMLWRQEDLESELSTGSHICQACLLGRWLCLRRTVRHY